MEMRDQDVIGVIVVDGKGLRNGLQAIPQSGHYARKEAPSDIARNKECGTQKCEFK